MKKDGMKPKVVKRGKLTFFEYMEDGNKAVYIFDEDQKLVSSYDHMPNGMHLASKHPGHLTISAQQVFSTAEAAMKQCIEWAGVTYTNKLIEVDTQPGTSDIPDVFKNLD